MLTPDQIEAFYSGQRLPERTLEEIEHSLEDPESLAAQISRESAQLTRYAFDPAFYTVVDQDSVHITTCDRSRE